MWEEEYMDEGQKYLKSTWNKSVEGNWRFVLQ